MRNRILLTIISGIMVMLSMAENYPYRSDLLWVTEPDHADWYIQSAWSGSVTHSRSLLYG